MGTSMEATSPHGSRRAWALAACLALAVLTLVAVPGQQATAAPCDAPVVNEIACENTKPGSPRSQWGITGSGSASIQGFATDISVNRGSTVGFKVRTTATSYRLDIYRMGYYGGAGARLVTSVSPTSFPRQPACLTQASTGLVDCGNWSQTASWAVPSDAVSGVYFAKLVAGSAASHIVFVVRDDSSRSALLFQTADTTWQAYNDFGGNSLYEGSPAGRAYKVSYNRPFDTAAETPEDWVFNAEYPLIRFLEANGYDVSYTTGVDTDRRGHLLANHRAFLSVGHDEYWSGGQRTAVEAARDAGVHLAFFSGNEVFWKTRWESSIAPGAAAHRTLVSYKETLAGAKIDPTATWTGTWRDPRFSPPADGGRPENALTGTAFTVNCCTTDMTVDGTDGSLRFWRDTRVAGLAPGQTTTLGSGVLGYEWDSDLDNGHRPAGLIRLSTTTRDVPSLLQDHGSSYAPGSATHHLVMYRAPSGALVFGAGSVQWSWGLDDDHDGGDPVTSDAAVRQATVNLFADMGAQPATLQPGLVRATASTDTAPPVSAITSPAPGATVPAGEPVTVSGTATDTGGRVGGVEVSVDGGATWHPASGRASWTYTFTPVSDGAITLRSRAADDSGRVETPSAGRTLTVGGSAPPGTCPCSLWPANATPAVAADPDTSSIEVGVRFRPSQSGAVTGIRFYKGTGNTGTHVGSLWSATGTRLASATFATESASGWQRVDFASPVPVTAGTPYVASYFAPNGRYSTTEGYFRTARTNGPLTAPADGSDGPNGVYRYGASGFPAQGYAASNYWVDVTFTTDTTDTTAPTVADRRPAPGATGVAATTPVSATFSEDVQGAAIALSPAAPGTVAYDPAARRATFTPSTALAPQTAYTVTVSGARDAAGNTMSPDTWTFTTGSAPTGACPCTIWPPSATPAVAADPDTDPVELGVKLRTAEAGFITGIRFYKSPGNTGTHVASLWSATGTRLAGATFAGETASGWQRVLFDQPVAVTANTTYVASYFAPVGRYSVDENYFALAGTTRGPLTALRSGTDGGNGVYRYGSTGFPTSTYRAGNYWVDVEFTTN